MMCHWVVGVIPNQENRFYLLVTRIQAGRFETDIGPVGGESAMDALWREARRQRFTDIDYRYVATVWLPTECGEGGQKHEDHCWIVFKITAWKGEPKDNFLDKATVVEWFQKTGFHKETIAEVLA